MNKKLIIEARVNEYTTRTKSPKVPLTPEEIIAESAACREAGAAIFHFHGRSEDGGADLTYPTFRKIVSGVRQLSDVLIQPTLGVWVQNQDPIDRLGNIVALVEEGLHPEFAPLDMGSTNVDLLDETGTRFVTDQFTNNTVYVNSTPTLESFASRLGELGVKPYLHLWNGPQARLAVVFQRMGILDGPLWMGFSHSGPSAPIHHPATAGGLDAYLAMIPDDVSVEWTINAYDANLFTLVPRAIELGGHISIGIGDYPYEELGFPSNVEVIQQVARIARDMGRELATPEEAREILKVPAPVNQF